VQVWKPFLREIPEIHHKLSNYLLKSGLPGQRQCGVYVDVFGSSRNFPYRMFRMYKRKAESQEVPHEAKHVTKIQRTPELKAVPNSSPARVILFVNATRGPVDIIFSYGTLVDHAIWASLNKNLNLLCVKEKEKLADFDILEDACKRIHKQHITKVKEVAKIPGARPKTGPYSRKIHCRVCRVVFVWPSHPVCYLCEKYCVLIQSVSRGERALACQYAHPDLWGGSPAYGFD
jgi:hypothetical protein